MKSKTIKVIQIIHHRDGETEIVTDARRRFHIKNMSDVREMPEVGDKLGLVFDEKMNEIEVFYKGKTLMK